MPLRPIVIDGLVDHVPFRSQIGASLMIIHCLFVAMLLVGCMSVSPPYPQEAQVVVSGPERPVASWSSQTRNGREALFDRDFDAAEALFISALDASSSFRSRDVRVDVSFGNLVQLASVYERIGRAEDAKRVLATIESSAGRRRLAARRIANYQTRYETLSASALSTRLEPAVEVDQKDFAPYDRLIRKAGSSFDVDPALVKAVVAAESNFEPRAVSRVGAQGLMQLMPATARAMGVRRPFAPSENLRGGVRYLRSLLDRFEKLDLALAAYNAGPEVVKRHGGIPPYPETEAYVTKVLSHYRRYQAGFSQ
jgi:soluble lytic murein transglycosylase-like protein